MLYLIFTVFISKSGGSEGIVLPNEANLFSSFTLGSFAAMFIMSTMLQEKASDLTSITSVFCQYN